MKPGVWRWLKKQSDVNVAIIIFSVTLIGIIWGTVIAEGRAERAEAIANAIKQNSNLAVAYEEHVIRTVKGLDAITQFVRHEYGQFGAKMSIASLVEAGVIDAKLFSILSVVDEHGNVVLSSSAIPPTNYADRGHFKTHQQSTKDDLYISTPVLGRVSGTWQIPITRRINKPDGSFGGIVVLSVDPGYFTEFYKKADLGHDGLVTLVGLDGVARARRVGDVLSFGDDISKSGFFKELTNNRSGGFFNGGKLDGIRRYVSYRVLAEYPLVVAVGTSEREVLSGFVLNRARDRRTAGLVSAVIAIFAGLLIMAIARQKRAATALAADITERKRLEAELRELATTDMLTGLPNRRQFLTCFAAEHARLQRFEDQHAAVLMLDLDFFKHVNDTHGHAAGDAVLRHFADLIRREIRQVDTGSRVGGEEFAIILPGAPRAAALDFADRLRKRVTESPVVHGAETIHVTVSIGIAAMDAKEDDPDAALLRADAALYRAKERGRNRVEIIAD
jgi:diguanylate cyclase (GGDEF)-like protein